MTFLQALNPVVIIILVHTENTYEHSLYHEDEVSLQIPSIAITDGDHT